MRVARTWNECERYTSSGIERLCERDQSARRAGRRLPTVRILTARLLRFYALSIILGTVALSYGSVPLYKMVSWLPSGQYPE